MGSLNATNSDQRQWSRSSRLFGRSSARGDPAGFVFVLDEKTLAIPDRPGNRRVDSFENIFVNPPAERAGLVAGDIILADTGLFRARSESTFCNVTAQDRRKIGVDHGGVAATHELECIWGPMPSFMRAQAGIVAHGSEPSSPLRRATLGAGHRARS